MIIACDGYFYVSKINKFKLDHEMPIYLFNSISGYDH